MIIVMLAAVGLCLGSFVNALVWRLHEQHKPYTKKRAKREAGDLSIIKGRSMCPHCRHTLQASDLVPVLSWLELRGKCRYCHKPISWQYPLVEIATAALFILSYRFFPYEFSVTGWLMLLVWLVALVVLMAMVVYDFRWMLLPNKLTYILLGAGVVFSLIKIIGFQQGTDGVWESLWGFVLGGGVFYALFQVSGGRWIGGGDVKLGAALGLFVGGPLMALLLIFVASCLGSLVAAPLLITRRLTPTSHMPYGPFLIFGAIIVFLFGADLNSWYLGLIGA